MGIDLFNQTLLLTVSFLSFIALSYCIVKNDTYLRLKLRRNVGRLWMHSSIVVIGAVVIGICIRFIIQAQFPQDDIPWELIGWAMPLGAALILWVYNLRSWRNSLIAVGGVTSSLVLALLLANNYYHYYPTPNALFEQDRTAVAAPAMGTPGQGARTVLEQYYLPPMGQPKTGELQPLTIPASGTFSPKQGRIYLPPALHNNDMITLPVLVLLPGYPGAPTDWEQAGILSIMNDFANKHKGLAPIVAVVDPLGASGADTECVDSKLGAAETYLTKDVPNYLRAHYQVSRDARDWIIAGYSAGGTCSTLIALRNPSVYQNFINISGDAYPSLKTHEETSATLFGGSQANEDAHTPDLLLKKGNPLYKTMHAWYFVGEQDNPEVGRRIRDQVALASNAGMTVMEKSTNGHHGFLVWKTGYIDSLPWMMNQLRMTTDEN